MSKTREKTDRAKKWFTYPYQKTGKDPSGDLRLIRGKKPFVPYEKYEDRPCWFRAIISLPDSENLAHGILHAD